MKPKTKEQSTHMLTKGFFYKKLRQNHEDIRVIKNMERLIRSCRTHVFLIPKPGASVVLLLSGGLDSIIAWDMLFRIYRLHVYPIMIPTSARDPQIKSVHYYTSYYKKKFPTLFHKPYITTPSTINQEPFMKIKPHNMPAATLLNLYNPDYNRISLGISGTNIFTAVTASAYSLFLSRTEAVAPSTILYAATADDGISVSSQTFSFLRMMMFMLMRLTNDNTLQFGSIFYESTLQAAYKKSEVLALGLKEGLPLHKTYSCDRRRFLHCGTCVSCVSRQYCYRKNGMPDPTIYENDLRPAKLLRRLAHKIKRLILSN